MLQQLNKISGYFHTLQDEMDGCVPETCNQFLLQQVFARSMTSKRSDQYHNHASQQESRNN